MSAGLAMVFLIMVGSLIIWSDVFLIEGGLNIIDGVLGIEAWIYGSPIRGIN